jgi:intron-binding protein aquarius
MPTAKRQKKSSGKEAHPAKQATQESAVDRPTIADIEGESEFAQLARKHWLKATKRTTKVKVKNDVVKKDLWDVLERDSFPYKSLLVLEGLQTLERYGSSVLCTSTRVC